MNEKETSDEYPNDCSECQFYNRENLLNGLAHFPSLCSKDLLWVECNGKKGIKKQNREKEHSKEFRTEFRDLFGRDPTPSEKLRNYDKKVEKKIEDIREFQKKKKRIE